MGLIGSIFVVLTLVWFVQCQVTLESCRMECGHVLGVRTQNASSAFMKPRSCRDVSTKKPNWSNGGVYTIFPYQDANVGVQVYCDVVTDGGGWIVFQKRVNGTEDFFRGWDDYVSGFGKLDDEFWLGLDTIHNLTKGDEYEMRVDLEDFEGEKAYATYSTFVVSRPPFYSLRVAGYHGTAGNAMTSTNFSTKDRDQDTSGINCAQTFKGGWWYHDCHAANLNGLYLRGTHTTFANGVNWQPWKGYRYSLKIAEMKLRRK